MEAKDVHDAHVRHEEKCDKRQTVIHDKIDHLEKVVYIGMGMVAALQFIGIAFGAYLLNKGFS